ncbi:hypothetical protein ACFSGX_14015 [Sphingomonas arantia]|uniref:DUF7146 domain-containing protein n=1 Tax=Sphingomonas arantia TaxID=1460676 RepID=A0ABW4TYS5_9SPHN
MNHADPDLFQRARKVSAGEVAARHDVKLALRGRYLRGPCPFCGAGERSKSDAFQAEDKGPFWLCHACQRGGDAILLEAILGGHGEDGAARYAAAKVLAGDAERILVARAARETERAERSAAHGDRVDSAVVGTHIWNTAQPARDEIVEAWLRSRGLDPDGLPGAIDLLRYHPRCPVLPWREGADPEAGWTAPAMIVRMDVVLGTRFSRLVDRVGVHATYLAPHGRAKAVLRMRDGSEVAARKMWGPARGAGCWLTPIDGEPSSGPLLVGEGIETVWSMAQQMIAAGRPVRALAVLSLGNLEGGLMKDARGAIPLWAIQSDPLKPPLTIPDAGDVVVLVDADMKPLRDRLIQRTRGARRERGEIGTLQRAEICASLAVQAWRRTPGVGTVSARRPPLGMDFNDHIRSEGRVA